MRLGRLAAIFGTAVIALAVLAPPPAGTGPQARASTQRTRAHPDIIVIISDDQPNGLIDVMPNVQRQLGNPGVRYTRSMVPTALCCPSRSSLLTGMYSHDTKVWDNGTNPKLTSTTGGYWGFVEHDNENKTLAVSLSRAGYRTGLIGKYLNGYERSYGTPPGWDVWLPFDSKASYYRYRFDGQRRGTRPQDYSTDVIARRAVRTIKRTDASRPLFLVVAPYGPHWPHTPAPRDQGVEVGRYVHGSDFGALNEPKASDKAHWIRTLPRIAPRVALKSAKRIHRSAMAVDDLVGKVTAALRQRSSLHHTLLVFVSDNGYLLGEHRILGKDVPYASATEVPLFVRYDPKLPSGSTSARLVLNIDLTATMAAAAGVRSEMPWVQGHSILRRPPKRPGFVLEATYSSMHNRYEFHRPPYCGWRTDDSLFVRYATGFEEFYRYPQDPEERTNMIHQDRWHKKISQMRHQARSHCRPQPPGFNWGN